MAAGDQLLVELKGEGGKEVVVSQTQTITLADIRKGFAVINLQLPEKPELEVSESDGEVKVPGTSLQPQLTGDINGDGMVISLIW